MSELVRNQIVGFPIQRLKIRGSFEDVVMNIYIPV